MLSHRNLLHRGQSHGLDCRSLRLQPDAIPCMIRAMSSAALFVVSDTVDNPFGEGEFRHIVNLRGRRSE